IVELPFDQFLPRIFARSSDARRIRHTGAVRVGESAGNVHNLRLPRLRSFDLLDGVNIDALGRLRPDCERERQDARNQNHFGALHCGFTSNAYAFKLRPLATISRGVPSPFVFSQATSGVKPCPSILAMTSPRSVSMT